MCKMTSSNSARTFPAPAFGFERCEILTRGRMDAYCRIKVILGRPQTQGHSLSLHDFPSVRSQLVQANNSLLGCVFTKQFDLTLEILGSAQELPFQRSE